MDDHKNLSVDSTLADMLAHPALAPFAIHLLPDPEVADVGLPLNRLAELMPWHTEIRPEIIVRALNHLISETSMGRIVFHCFSGARHTGIFHLRGKKDAPFALICPGGGFRYVATLHEGLPIAISLQDLGYNAFIVKYRAGGERIACKDMANALGWIFSHAVELGTATTNYSIWGGSAGARMAADLGTYGAYSLGGPELPFPCAVIMAYTSHVWHLPGDPPTFAVVGENDETAPPYVMKRRIKEMAANGIDAQIRIFPDLGHGFGTGDGTCAEGWVHEAVSFWQKHVDMH